MFSLKQAGLIGPSTHGAAMSTIKGFVCGLLAGTGLAAFATQYHLVRSNEGVLVVPRSEKAPLRSTYVDVREWSLAMWREYPEVSTALTRTGRADLITEGVASGMAEEFGLPRGTTDAPTAQRADSLVPIRFLDPQAETLPRSTPPAPQQQQSPVNRPPASVPWEDFLKGTTRGADASTAPASGFSDQAAITPTTPTTTNEPPLTYRPLTATRAVESAEEVVPDLFRPIANIRKPNESFSASLADVIQTQTDEVANYVFSESPEAPSPATPLDPTSEAPKREWVRGLLQSLIPQSKAPAEVMPNRQTTSTTIPQLDAPLPGESMDSMPLSFTYPNTVAPPSRAIRPF